MSAREEALAALNRLAKWRTLLAGWQVGTKPKGDPECDAIRDHREVTLMLRAEASCLATLLVRKGLITEEEWARQLQHEADALSADLEQRFPGVRACDDGLIIDKRVLPWMKGWKE